MSSKTKDRTSRECFNIPLVEETLEEKNNTCGQRKPLEIDLFPPSVDQMINSFAPLADQAH